MYYGSDVGGAIAAVAGVILIIALIAMAVVVLLWVLRSLGLMTLAKNRGLANPWLAWIPVVGVYTLGAIADDINEKEGSRSFFRYILLGGSILNMLLSGATYGSTFTSILNDPYDYSGMLAAGGLSSIGGLISLAFYIITIICLNRIFKCYRPGSSTSWTVLCVFLPFMQSIFPFTIRNSQPNWINPPYQGGPGGYNPNQGGSWQGQQQGGYAPPPQGGYAPPQDGGYYNPAPGDNNYGGEQQGPENPNGPNQG